MKTFSDWCSFYENSAMDIGKSTIGSTSYTDEQEGLMADLFRGMKIATAKHKSAVMRFLRSLAPSEPEIQQIIDKIGHEGNLAKMAAASRKGLSVGASPGHEDGDVVVPAGPDANQGDA